MEDSNNENAQRAMDLAEKKLLENDYNGAKEFANKAQNLYPKFEGLEQVLMMINVYISASNNRGGESAWYGVIGVDPLSSKEALKKQYKKLALLLHPDKNMHHGAEGAFKVVVLEAWSILSDEIKRSVYDRSLNVVKHKEPASSDKEEASDEVKEGIDRWVKEAQIKQHLDDIYGSRVRIGRRKKEKMFF